ncbi:MAG: hypothetical protein LBH59_09425, partial [Planctomycetaceae bacterium]|nr:hypothetical protein [Planctomycetaceae bacterium]
QIRAIPKPVWAVGFALEQTLHVVTLAVFSYVDFKIASADMCERLPFFVTVHGFCEERVFKIGIGG